MEQKIKVGINGFGRIGRGLVRVLMPREKIEVVALNDLASLETMAHLLKYDSVHGRFPWPVHLENEKLRINNSNVSVYHEADPGSIPWENNGVDIVIEATGLFKTQKLSAVHLKPGVKKVILSAPPVDDEIKTVVLGVNETILDGTEKIISNASCTTNCAAPMIQIINEKLGIESAYVTTVHSFTTDQKLHDSPHKDLRRARAATLSMVPTTTGAAKALSIVFPHLNGHLGGCGIRVPVPDGSLTDITFQVKTETTVEEVNGWFSQAAKGKLKGMVGYTEEPLVSADILGLPHSVLFDAQLTSVLGKMVKIVGWYDNEMGYSHRLADLIEKVCD